MTQIDAIGPVPASVGRLMRFEEGRWRPVGEPLPPFDHAPPNPGLVLAPWVLPRTPAPRGADVVVVGELAHQLVARCEPDDPLYVELAHQTMILRSYEETLAWLDEIELWIGRRLEPRRPWPTRLPG